MASKYLELTRFDLIGKCMPLFQAGWYMDASDNRIKAMPGQDLNAPWVQVRQNPAKPCLFFHQVQAGCLGYIPTPCLNCYKVVARPRTVVDLFKVLEVQENRLLEYFCKCGVETRPTVKYPYGAYWYFNSAADGLINHRIVKVELHRDVDPDMEVVLKRGCTEFEQRFGPSDKWQPCPDEAIWQTLIDQYFDVGNWTFLQPAAVKLFVKRRWIEMAAYQVKDPTYLALTGGAPFHFEPVTYHEPRRIYTGVSSLQPPASSPKGV